MKCLAKLAFALIALMLPVMAADEPAKESACNESIGPGELISVAEIHKRLVSMSWPELSPFMRQARMSTPAVFQIKVSSSGSTCAVEFIGGNRLILAPLLTPEIKKWKFRPNEPFLGIIAIWYESSWGFRLL